MIKEISKKQKRKFHSLLSVLTLILTIVVLLSFSIGHYGIFNIRKLCHIFLYFFTRQEKYFSIDVNIAKYIRLPRIIASILIGGALSVAGLVYQIIFKNKLVSPDLLGVSAGCCVGAGIAILIGVSTSLITVFSFLVGLLSVTVALILPKLFKNDSTVALVLSGIIVGAFMNSVVGLLKYLADQEDKLSTITFWMMGSLAGTTLNELIVNSAITLICFLVLMLMNFRIDAISLGKEEATSIGLKYKPNMLIVVVCSTFLTASTVSLCGNVGWIGLVIPHITRQIVCEKAEYSIPVSFLLGSIIMVVVDLLSRTISVDEIPLSILTGILGAIIYSVLLIKKGILINE